MLDLMRKHASGWLVKIIFGLIIIVFVAWGVNFTAKNDNVVAYVNEEPITVREFGHAYDQSLRRLKAQSPQVTSEDLKKAQFKQAVLARLINTRLMEQQAQSLGLDVSATEIRQVIQSIPAFQNEDRRFDFDRYKAVLAQEGQSAPQFENSMRQDYVVQRLMSYLGLPGIATDAQARNLYDYLLQKAVVEYVLFDAKEFLDKTAVKDEEITEFYQNNQELFVKPAQIQINYLSFTPEDLASSETIPDEDIKAYYETHQAQFTHPESVKVRHILIAVDEDASPQDVQKAKEKAEKLLARLKIGADFAKIAEKNSDGPSAERGGEIGWMTRGQMVKPFEDAAFELQPGQISDPVRTRFGWHLIKIEEHEPEGVSPLEKVRNEIRDILAEEQASDRVTALLDKAMEQASAGAKLEDIAKNLDLRVKQSDLADLQTLRNAFGMTEEAAQTLFNRPVGMIADTPLAIEDGYLLAEKITENPESVQPLADVRGAVEKRLQTDKAQALALEQARAALKRLQDPAQAPKELKALSAKIQTSEPFGRKGFIPGLGASPLLAGEAFDAKVGAWLPEAYEMNSGAVIAKLDRMVPASAEDWDAQKERWTDTLSDQMQREVVAAFLTEVRDKSDIQVVQPDMLQ
ncbi:MAG: peptidyl-prolyl cis-trans isomerase [Desulfovibrionales bacterium]|nr:peptidyl-prolyl cis-trans isomerase [Desulfovibrionales bacterium]